MGSDEGEIIRWFDEVSQNAGAVQQETLRRILELNYGVEYLRNWLGDIGNVREIEANKLEEIYTTMVPLVSHADVEPYVQRIADGDSSPILTQQRITHLSLSSGTTEGRQKYIPFTRHSAQTTLLTCRLAAAYRSRVYPTEPGGRVLEFIYSSKQFKTKGGLTAGTATTHYFSSNEFKMKQDKTRSFTCSPHEVISSGDYKQTTYCHLLLGLYFSSKVEFVSSTFVYSIVHALVAFEELWKDLCDDIREGSLSLRITIPSVRQAVLKILTPNPCLAARIRDACLELEKMNWSGLIPKLLPSVKYVYSIMTGSMQPYLKKLRHYAGDLPLISADYGSTESWIGVNVDPASPPENVTFAVVPTFSYFEFIPLHRSCKNGNLTSIVDDFIEHDPVPLTKVKIGQQYEVVLTTFTGKSSKLHSHRSCCLI
uniref:GH3 middle domain-containing protein n=1 Tax=Opuntia streptacantha TaxID=393608 RepID=A0A7C8Z5R0_OPUST